MIRTGTTMRARQAMWANETDREHQSAHDSRRVDTQPLAGHEGQHERYTRNGTTDIPGAFTPPTPPVDHT